jgi:class 3 adenylate cyclase
VVDNSPETLYVKSADGVHIAYQVFGDHPIDLLFMPSGVSHLEVEWESPELARFLRGLGAFARVIRFDMRGTGLSDPASPNDWPTLEQRADDALTVLDAIGSERAALLGGVVGGQLAMFCTAAHPDRTSALVLAGTMARYCWAPDYAWGAPADEQDLREGEAEQGWEQGVGALRLLAPSTLGDPGFVSWWYRLFRQSTGRGAARALVRTVFETDLRSLLPAIRRPTLVLCRANDKYIEPAHARYLAAHIRQAQLVELPGEDNLMYVGDTGTVIGEIEEFLTGVRHPPAAERVLATVMFTDMVGSTHHAAELGDRRWRDLLDAHDRTIRRQLERFRGREVDTAGDAFLATFDGPGRAILCACAIRDAVRALGIEVRAGLHTGEIERRGEDVAGMAVHIGARVSALARGGEVLVSSTVKDLVAGSGIEFEDRGEHQLKGVPDSWRLYAVAG